MWRGLVVSCLLGLCCASALAQETPEDADAGVPEAPALELPQLETQPELILPNGTAVPADGVEVQLAIAADGSVSDATVHDSLGIDADAAVLAAARQLHFKPARRFGTPIAVQINFRFRLATPVPPEAPTPPPFAAATKPPPTAAEPEPEPLRFGARGRTERPPPGAVSRIKLTGAELTQVPGTFGEPLRVVATLPGVARSPFGLGFFIVRGAAFQNTGFFVDDYPVPLLYHLGAGPAILASRLVESLDFYPGGYPVSLGRYTAGVIALHTAAPKTESAMLEFEVDALRASGMVVVPLPDGRGSVALAIRRSYFELILPLITDSVSLSYTDYQLRLDVKLTEKLRASVFFFGSRDDLTTDSAAFASGGMGGNSGSSSGLHYAFDQAIAALDWDPSSRLHMRWSGTVGPSNISFSAGRQGADSVGTNTDAWRLGERLEARVRETAQLETRLGGDLDIFLATVRAAAPSIGELPNIPSPGPPTESIELTDNLTQLGFAPWLEQVWRPQPVEVTLGMRAEYMRYARTETWLPEPRAVVRLGITPSFYLKGGSGLFSQAPLPFQVLTSAGNPLLKPNRAFQNSLGVELKLPLAVEVESNVFYNYMWQLTRSDATLYVDASDRVRPRFYADDGLGQAYGWELMVRRRMGHGLSGWLSYTLSRSERYLEHRPTQVFNFDQTHVLNLAGSYELGKFRFSARYTLATGRPVGEVLDASGNSTIFDSDGNDLDPAVRGRMTRLPTFHQLDIRIDHDFKWGPMNGSVYIDIINVYNAQNGEGYQYEYDFSKRGNLPGLPFLPTLGIRGTLK